MIISTPWTTFNSCRSSSITGFILVLENLECPWILLRQNPAIEKWRKWNLSWESPWILYCTGGLRWQPNISLSFMYLSTQPMAWTAVERSHCEFFTCFLSYFCLILYWKCILMSWKCPWKVLEFQVPAGVRTLNKYRLSSITLSFRA